MQIKYAFRQSSSPSLVTISFKAVIFSLGDLFFILLKLYLKNSMHCYARDFEKVFQNPKLLQKWQKCLIFAKKGHIQKERTFLRYKLQL